jgi:hypothetical protein
MNEDKLPIVYHEIEPERSYTMSTSIVHDQKPAGRCMSVLFPFLKHINTRTIALIMFFGLALLSNIRGTETETEESAPTKTTKSGVVVIDKRLELLNAVRLGILDDSTRAAQGYLKVYSATDKFNDGGLAYYPHSSYAVYTTDGKFFKSVENHISPSDESPELVTLPVGTYLVMARSDRDGEVSIRVTIEANELTALDLEVGERGTGQAVR